MSGTYDEETRKLLEARKRRAEQRRAQQIKKRNTIILGIGVLIVLIILIAVISASCSSKKDNKKEPVTQAKQVETEKVTEPVTTQEETTTPETSMYTTDILNLRKEPTTQSDIITQIGAGKKVIILGYEGEWCKVQRGKDTGYVMKKYLSYDNTVD